MIDYPRPGPVWLLAALAWFGTAVSIGPVLENALEDTRTAGKVIAQILFWGVYFCGCVCILLPRPTGAVFLRVGAFLFLQVAFIAAITADNALFWRVQAGIAGIYTLGLQLLPSVGDRQMDGASYPGERRFAFKIPPETALGAIGAISLPCLCAWSAFWAGSSSGNTRIFWGLLAFLLAPISVLFLRRLVFLANRCIIFTPRALVAHDLYFLEDPLSIPLTKITEVAPAPSNVDALGLLDLRCGRKKPWVQLLTEAPFSPPPGRRMPDRFSYLQVETPEIALGIALAPTRLDTFLEAARRRCIRVHLPPELPPADAGSPVCSGSCDTSDPNRVCETSGAACEKTTRTQEPEHRQLHSEERQQS